jgi:hypothetical protein
MSQPMKGMDHTKMNHTSMNMKQTTIVGRDHAKRI